MLVYNYKHLPYLNHSNQSYYLSCLTPVVGGPYLGNGASKKLAGVLSIAIIMIIFMHQDETHH